MSDEAGIDFTPALTPEEWHELAQRIAEADCAADVVEATGEAAVAWALEPGIEPIELHKAAAICLHGQPFGFTHEDVRLLCEEAESEWNGEQMETGRKLLALAARIAALLPPDGGA